MRIVDVFLAVPELILALAIAAILGPSFRNIIIAISILGWPKYARIIRGQILHIKQNEYVDAANVIGDSRWRIYRKDLLPNAITPVVVQATLEMGHVVLFGATLSFIGLAEAGLAEWGNLVSEGREGIVAGRWWVATFGGLMVFLWSLAFNLVGDGFRDVLDPRDGRAMTACAEAPRRGRTPTRRAIAPPLLSVRRPPYPFRRRSEARRPPSTA